MLRKPPSVSRLFAICAAMAAAGLLTQPLAAQDSGHQEEGIAVHGHWTIEVVNPDGSVASRTEFENALTSAGITFMTMFVGRSRTVGAWTVSVGGVGSGPCLGGAGQAVACFIQEPGYPGGGGNHFVNLTVSDVPQSINDPATGMVLSGTATAQMDASVSQVSTQARPCAATASPIDCAAGNAPNVDGGAVFTIASLPSAVAVQTGQSILVTVVISFS